MASLFAKIEGAAKSTVAWLEKELIEVEGKAPTIERVIDAGLGYVGPALQLGLTALGDVPAAAAVGVVVAKAQSDLLAASALVTDFGATPTAASMFASVKTNLSALLTAGQITNAKTVATITKSVSEVGTIASAVQLAATEIAAAAAPQPAAA